MQVPPHGARACPEYDRSGPDEERFAEIGEHATKIHQKLLGAITSVIKRSEKFAKCAYRKIGVAQNGSQYLWMQDRTRVIRDGGSLSLFIPEYLVAATLPYTDKTPFFKNCYYFSRRNPRKFFRDHAL
jgi:hypothetical protein